MVFSINTYAHLLTCHYTIHSKLAEKERCIELWYLLCKYSLLCACHVPSNVKEDRCMHGNQEEGAGSVVMVGL